MTRSIFGWDLPPGCTMADIDRAYGDSPLFDELFESQANLTEDEKKLWREICDSGSQPKFDLIIKALEWAVELGYKQCEGNEEEHKFYESHYHQQVRIPRLRAYFKSLRIKAKGGEMTPEIKLGKDIAITHMKHDEGYGLGIDMADIHIMFQTFPWTHRPGNHTKVTLFGLSPEDVRRLGEAILEQAFQIKQEVISEDTTVRKV